jgi:hypothetical protein
MKTRSWKGAALAALLLGVGACSNKEQEPAPAAPAAAAPQAGNRPASAPLVDAQGQRVHEQPSKEPERPLPPVTALEENKAPLPKDFALGQSREVVVGLLSECGERVHFLPGGAGGLSVEVYQPKEGKCRERLGERRFMVVGGVLKEIVPGTQPPPPPPKPAPEGA